jgi:hypothetical protein
LGTGYRIGHRATVVLKTRTAVRCARRAILGRRTSVIPEIPRDRARAPRTSRLQAERTTRDSADRLGLYRSISIQRSLDGGASFSRILRSAGGRCNG